MCWVKTRDVGWRSKEIRWLYVVVLVRAERAAFLCGRGDKRMGEREVW